MDATAVGHYHDLFPGVAEDGHHLMEILPKVLGIKMGHDFIENAVGAILDSPDDMVRYCFQTWRLHTPSRLIWLGLRGRVGSR